MPITTKANNPIRILEDRMKTIDEAINYAAEHLPIGSQVEIMIEKDGYGVILITPKKRKGFHMQHSMSEESIIDDIVVATDKANSPQ